MDELDRDYLAIKGRRYRLVCPNCGEYETTATAIPTLWELFWKNWHRVGDCPHCETRWNLDAPNIGNEPRR